MTTDNTDLRELLAQATAAACAPYPPLYPPALRPWPVRIGCMLGVHRSGTIDGGAMGDARRCDWCGYDTYGRLWLLNERRITDPIPDSYKPKKP